jgi:hypothetical protein
MGVPPNFDMDIVWLAEQGAERGISATLGPMGGKADIIIAPSRKSIFYNPATE